MSSGDGGLAPSSRNSGRGSGAAADDDGEEGAAARPAALRARAAITQSSPSMPRISRSSMDLPTSPALSERDYSDDSTEVTSDDDGGDDDDDEYEEDDEEDNMTVEERLEAANARLAESQDVVNNLVAQITVYRRVVEEEKERDKKRIATLLSEVEAQRQLISQLQEKLESSPTAAGDEALQNKVRVLQDQLEQQQQKTAELRHQTVANLKALQQDLANIDEENKALNAQLAEERATHKQTLQQLWALQKQLKEGGGGVQAAPHDQEIRLHVSFDGPAIKAAALVPENDKERSRLLEETDILKTKMLALNQTQCVLLSDLDAAKSDLARATASLRGVTTELEGLRRTHTATLVELERLRNDRSLASPSLTPRVVALSAVPGLAQPLPPRLESAVSASPSPSPSPSPSASPTAPTHRAHTPATADELQREASSIYARYCMPGLGSEDLGLGAKMRQELFTMISTPELITPQVFAPVRCVALEMLERDSDLARWLEEASPSPPPPPSSKTSTTIAGGTPPAGSATRERIESMLGSSEQRPKLQAYLEQHGKGSTMQFLLDVERFAQLTLVESPPAKRRHHRHRTMRRSHTSNMLDAPPLPQQSKSPLVVELPPTKGSASMNELPHFKAPAEDSAKRRSLSRERDEPASPLRLALAGSNRQRSVSSLVRPQMSRIKLGSKQALSGLVEQAPVSPPESPQTSPQASPHKGAASATAPSTPQQAHNRSFTTIQAGSAAAAQAAAAAAGAKGAAAEAESALVSPRKTYMRNLEELVGDELEPERVVATQTVPGAVSCIAFVPVYNVCVVNGTPSSIQSFSCDAAAPQKQMALNMAVVKMAYIEPYMWFATQDKDLRYLELCGSQCVHSLVGHTKGPVNDFVRAGNFVWSVAEDNQIGIWDATEMKRHKMIQTSWPLSCVTHVNGVIWIGTVVGIIFYDARTTKPIKSVHPTSAAASSASAASTAPPSEAPQETTPTKTAAQDRVRQVMRMSVDSLLHVRVRDRNRERNEVWAVHSCNNLISVWDASNRALISVVDAYRVRRLEQVGDYVWTCSWDNCVRCISTQTRAVVREMVSKHDDEITSIAVVAHRDTFRVWTGSSDHTVCVWSTDLRPHPFEESKSSARAGACRVCHKPIKSVFTKAFYYCPKCGCCVHRKCRSQLTPNDAWCPLAMSQQLRL